MKQVIKYMETRPVEMSLDVDFPIYSRKSEGPEDGCGRNVWTKIVSDRLVVQVTCTYDCGGSEWEVSQSGERVFDRVFDIDWLLGRSEHTCTEEEFSWACKQAILFIKESMEVKR